MDVFPEDSLTVLPFKPEPISRWTIENDLGEFITWLLPHSDYFFEQRRKELQVTASEFLLNAQKAVPPRSAEEKGIVETIPNFLDDEIFGLAAKYAIAWFIITQALLEESAFFSISHMLEAYTDLECCILLSSNLYYKQALQVLRGFLENAVLQLHFCDNGEEYVEWKRNEYRVPSLRGKKGILLKLLERGVLTEELATVVSKLYNELNGSIHGAERYLIHRGIFTGQYAGQIFKYDRFRQWGNYLARCTDFAIRAQCITVGLWAKQRFQSGMHCDICHSSNLEIGKSDLFDGDDATVFKCRECGNVMRFSTEWLSSKGLV